MKILDKVGLALFSMLVLVISVVLLLISFKMVDASIFSILIGRILMSQNNTYILEGICIMLSLLALRCLFFGQDSSSNAHDGILLQNNDGKLLITKDTIENIVEGVVGEFKSIESATEKVSIDNESNINVKLVLKVKKGTVIKDLSSELQKRVKQNVKQATNIQINTVDIEIQNVEVKTNDEKNVK